MSVSAAGPATSFACTDDALLVRTSGGDASALGKLYDRHAGRAFSVAWAICRDPQRAEDAVQEAFLSLWRSSGSYQTGRGIPTSWLMTVVRSRAIDVLRYESARTGKNVALDELNSVASSDDVDAMVARQLEAKELRGLIADLPRGQREAITLAYFGGLTQLEIARHLGLPHGTVKSRIRLGLEKLRDAAVVGTGGREVAVTDDFVTPAGGH